MYRLNLVNNQLEEIQETTFFENKERQHIEDWIRKNPEVFWRRLTLQGVKNIELYKLVVKLKLNDIQTFDECINKSNRKKREFPVGLSF